jgi:putative heme-binding domain-containing protein
MLARNSIMTLHKSHSRASKFLFVFLLFSWFGQGALSAALPQWIWHDNKGAMIQTNEVRFFRKTFDLERKPTKALLSLAADDEAVLFINGKEVAKSIGFDKPTYKDVTRNLVAGENTIAIRAKNVASDLAGVIAMLELQLPKRQKQVIITDTTWLSSASGFEKWEASAFDSGKWTAAISKGKLGDKPWGDAIKLPEATPAEQLTLLPGFKVELIHNSEPGEGSWVAMTTDPFGRLIISPQQGTNNMLRVTLNRDGSVQEIERINLPVGSAMGLLWAYKSLYVNGAGPNGLGLYRVVDTNYDGRLDAVKLVRKFEKAEGEHGSHAVLLGPDKKIYVMNGNFVKVPPDISPSSPHKNYADDQLLPRANDGNGFGNGVLPPGGFVLRMDYDGKNCELFCAGLRNTYDFGFNPAGELFGFDSDMEWDWGTPWYRPIRVLHLVSGGDYGFREGTGKFPEHYSDTLPATLNVGIGSPTGVKFGANSKFPQKYRDAFYIMDWSYGRILAAHLNPEGATYTGNFETFVKGKPLNVTDLEFGKDGAMYFITGGRGTQSGLYRVSYVGTETRATKAGSEKQFQKARELRHQLEKFHGKQDKRAIALAWPHLNSNDRWIRYAARIAIESQPVAGWKARALTETRTNAALTALLALVRVSGKETQNDLLLALKNFPMDNLTEAQQLEKLRVIELSFTRQGKPAPELAKLAIEKLDRLYPAKSEKLNRELCQLLLYLDAPNAVSKTVSLLNAAKTQEEQIYYVYRLRTVTNGWTMEDRTNYFAWFNKSRAGIKHTDHLLEWFKDAGRDYADGSSFPKFMTNFQKEAMSNLTENVRAELAAILFPPPPNTNADAKPRVFIKEWKSDELLSSLDEAAHNRSFERGKEAFAAAQCLSCHKFGNEGGAIGPDLTAISSRFARRDIFDSIIEPSKVVSEQYQNVNIIKKSGIEITGRIVEEDDEKIIMLINPVTGEKTEVRKESIGKREAAKLSPMPEGLVNILTKEEILDLIAYLESGGKKDFAAFAKKSAATQ